MLRFVLMVENLTLSSFNSLTSAQPKIVHSGMMTFYATSLNQKIEFTSKKTRMWLIDRPIRLTKKFRLYSKVILWFHSFQDGVQSLDTTHCQQNTWNERDNME